MAKASVGVIMVLVRMMNRKSFAVPQSSMSACTCWTGATTA